MLPRQEVIAFAAFPVLVLMGLAVGVALAAVGRWRDGISLGLLFWVGAGLLNLGIASTWAAIATSAFIITLRHLLVPALKMSAPKQD